MSWNGKDIGGALGPVIPLPRTDFPKSAIVPDFADKIAGLKGRVSEPVPVVTPAATAATAAVYTSFGVVGSGSGQSSSKLYWIIGAVAVLVLGSKYIKLGGKKL